MPLNNGYDAATVATLSQVPEVPMTDYSVKDRSVGQIVLINKTSPLDRVQVLKYQSREIGDIYKGSDVNPAMYSPNRTGRNIATVFSFIARATDGTDDKLTRDLPVKATVSVTIPNDAAITVDVVENALLSALSAWLYPSEWVDKADPVWGRAYALAKGALEPDLSEAEVTPA